jgi:capsular exopolysaccharide synthesis family protein
MRSNGWKTIAVSSPNPGAGKTLTAVNLAIMIGRDPTCKALLVDGDLRNPSVHRCFGYEPEFGLNDFLFNDVPLEKLFFHPDMHGLTVIPGREPIRESAETLAAPKLVNMLAEVRSRYADRIVIVDIAPILSVDDALSIRPNVDCLLMVVESGETKREDLARAIELIDPLPVIGTVLNKAARKTTAAY